VGTRNSHASIGSHAMLDTHCAKHAHLGIAMLLSGEVGYFSPTEKHHIVHKLYQ
jgi:hypothetical protein